MANGDAADDSIGQLRDLYPFVQWVTSESGRGQQMNAGAAHIESEAILFLHADTLLPPHAFLAIDQALSDPSCVGGRFDVQFEEDIEQSKGECG